MIRNYRIAQFGSLFSDGIEWAPSMTRAERRKFRQRLFRETLAQRLSRGVSAVLHLLGRTRELPQAVDFVIRAALIGHAGLPNLDDVRAVPDGIAGVINDLTPATLVEGYGTGFFPRWIFGQATWWSPTTRHIREPNTDRLAALKADEPANQSGGLSEFSVTLDRDFEEVAAACSRSHGARDATFNLSPAALHVFAAMHDQGFAHCFAVRDKLGKLVAGGFGVASGRIYATESVFETAPGALALGLATLDAHLADWQFRLHDMRVQEMRCEQMAELEFRPMAREPFVLLCAASQNGGCPGRWSEAENVPLADAFKSEAFTSAA
jgi:leucyl/phenylalanyl-tRNA--protein transferase